MLNFSYITSTKTSSDKSMYRGCNQPTNKNSTPSSKPSDKGYLPSDNYKPNEKKDRQKKGINKQQKTYEPTNSSAKTSKEHSRSSKKPKDESKTTSKIKVRMHSPESSAIEKKH